MQKQTKKALTIIILPRRKKERWWVSPDEQPVMVFLWRKWMSCKYYSEHSHKDTDTKGAFSRCLDESIDSNMHTYKQINKKRAAKGRACKVIGSGGQSSNPIRSVRRPSPLFYWMRGSIVRRPSPLLLSVWCCSIEHWHRWAKRTRKREYWEGWEEYCDHDEVQYSTN